jgi:hypothetical protein
VGHGVLDRVELATLPRHSGHDGLSGRLETGVWACPQLATLASGRPIPVIYRRDVTQTNSLTG